MAHATTKIIREEHAALAAMLRSVLLLAEYRRRGTLPGERQIGDLERALLGFEMMGESRRALFEESMQRYVDFCLAHMRTEEVEILPLAERVLTERDWSELDASSRAIATR